MLLGDVLLERGDEVVFADPSFTVYSDICRRHGAEAVTVPTRDFVHDLEAMAAAVTTRTKIVFVCNPNNPTGTYVPVADIAASGRGGAAATCSWSSTRPTTSSSAPPTRRTRSRCRQRTRT